MSSYADKLEARCEAKGSAVGRHILVDPEGGSQTSLTRMSEEELMRLSGWLDKQRDKIDQKRDEVAGMLEWRRKRRDMRNVLEFWRSAERGVFPPK